MKRIVCLLLSLFMMLTMLTSCDILSSIFDSIANTTTESEITTPEPDVTIPNSEVTTPEAEATTSKTEVTTPEPEINYGTFTNPVTVTYAYNVCADFAVDEISAKEFYVLGTITKIVEESNHAYFTDGRTELRIYFPPYVESSGLQVGDTITVYGYVMNYQGTLDISARSIIKENLDIEDPTYLFTDFTADEKTLFNDYFGFVIPFISNNKYFVEEYEFEDETGINFYTYENTQAEFDAYRSLFSSYTYDGSDIDDYGDTWYFYSKGDIYIDMSRYADDQGGYVVDIYVYTTNNNGEDVTDSDEPEIEEPKINYGTLNNPVSTTYAYNACANLANGESSAEAFYVRGTVTAIGEIGGSGNFYMNVYFTDGTTEMLIYTIDIPYDIGDFEVGDTIVACGYIKNYNGTIEMATYNGSVYVYVVKVESSNENQGGNTSEHLYTDFTADEKALFNDYFGFVIPFISNNKYFVEEYEFEDETGINFYTYENTQAEFDAYRALFSSYTYDGSEADDYGDMWYMYSKDNVCVDMSFYYYEGAYVVDIYIYLLDEDEDVTDPVEPEINYGTLNNPVSTTYAKSACASLANEKSSQAPFYVKGTVTKIGETKTGTTGTYYKNVYFTDGTTEMLIYTINMSNGITGFKVGDTIVAYGYIKNYDGTIEMATYNGSVYVYVVKVESASGNQGGGSSGGSNGGSGSNTNNNTNTNIITNNGKGLPQSSNGIYDVDFTKGNYVQNVTDQGYYIDGCPTTGSPAVLVIPVEFSDATAQSKGYSIANIKRIFCGTDIPYYSVHDYFFISSYEQLDLDITVIDSWFRPKNNSRYYENATYDYYGSQVAIGDQLILDEALAYLATIMDLSQFDSDNNGVIDAVVMVNTLDIGDDDFHWAYRYWNMYTDNDGYYYEYDNVSANDYVWVSYEFMFEAYDENGDANYDITNPLNSYTFIHEFSHILGADDYYDTTEETEPLGGCDVMDAMPGDHNPYSKFNFGWLTTSKLIVTNSTVTVNLNAFTKTGDTIIIANNWDESLGAYQEYYIIMYYTATGLNAGDAGYFLRDGIVVYHVNASLFAEEYEGETYYDVYNNNTSAKDEYGTQDNLIEYVLSSEGNYTYVAGDSLPTVTDDSGNVLGYTFVVDALTQEYATITFTKK